MLKEAEPRPLYLFNFFYAVVKSLVYEYGWVAGVQAGGAESVYAV